MEGDLYNLVPSVGAVNRLRRNYSFAELKPSKENQICKNGFVLEGRKVMPPNNKKGDIARIYFYMNQKYPGHGIISNKNKKLFNTWDLSDPVDEEECLLNKLKAKIMKGENEFVSKRCRK